MKDSPQLSSLTPQKAWKLIDKVPLQAKTSEIAEEMHRKIAKAKSAAYDQGFEKEEWRLLSSPPDFVGRGSSR